VSSKENHHSKGFLLSDPAFGQVQQLNQAFRDGDMLGQVSLRAAAISPTVLGPDTAKGSFPMPN